MSSAKRKLNFSGNARELPKFSVLIRSLKEQRGENIDEGGYYLMWNYNPLQFWLSVKRYKNCITYDIHDYNHYGFISYYSDSLPLKNPGK